MAKAAKVEGGSDWSKIKVQVTGDDALTVIFPEPIRKMVEPILQRRKEIPPEYLLAVLSHCVAARKARKPCPPPAFRW